jgi:ferrous iron transport protein B
VDERLLSSLRPSETGSVVRVEGPDDVRRRLVEMGFVPGVPVEVIGTAPLGDPLEVSLRGYRLAIRRSEAAGVTVVSGLPVVAGGAEVDLPARTPAVAEGQLDGPGADRSVWRRRRRQTGRDRHPQAAPFEPGVSATATVVVALAGNPNTGKSSLFNALTGGRQHVGNWPGKTVARAEGSRQVGSVTIRLVDLPGAYSLRAASPEEEAAREFLTSGGPDMVVAVVDSSNLERNLFLVLELAELGLPLVVAANMADLAERRGRAVAWADLAAELRAPVVPMVARKGIGVQELLDTILSTAEATRS